MKEGKKRGELEVEMKGSRYKGIWGSGYKNIGTSVESVTLHRY